MPRLGLRRFLVRTALAVPLALAPLSCGGGGGGGGSAGPTEPFDLASVTPNAQTAAHSSFAGEFAADYLRATHFDRLVVEVDFPEDRPPSPAALDLLRTRLAERCDKPVGVDVVVSDPIAVDEFPLRLNDDALDDLEAAHRDTFSDATTRTAAMYVLYVHGHSSLDTFNEGVVGISYRGGSFAIFVDRVDESAVPPTITAAEVEAGSIVHESGHLLGLVDNGVPMVSPHRDPSHGPHDASKSCVMYYLIQVPPVFPNLGDPDFMTFDSHCIDDLHAFGGLGPPPAPARVGTLTSDGYEPVVVGVCPCDRCGRPARRP
jgi:hypothetical protein